MHGLAGFGRASRLPHSDVVHPNLRTPKVCAQKLTQSSCIKDPLDPCIEFVSGAGKQHVIALVIF